MMLGKIVPELGVIRIALRRKTLHCPSEALRRSGLDGKRHRWSKDAIADRTAAIAAGLIRPSKEAS